MIALHLAAESSHTSALQVLCEKGADVNAVTTVGESLLTNHRYIIQHISGILSAGMVFCNSKYVIKDKINTDMMSSY